MRNHRVRLRRKSFLGTFIQLIVNDDESQDSSWGVGSGEGKRGGGISIKDEGK